MYGYGGFERAIASTFLSPIHAWIIINSLSGCASNMFTIKNGAEITKNCVRTKIYNRYINSETQLTFGHTLILGILDELLGL
jgi:hypothetical protein